MLMGSTGASDTILPLNMVASFRHQSIINMNEKGSALIWQDPTTPWNSNFSCLWNLWAKNLRTQINKCINYLPGEGGTPGAWSFSEMLLTPFFPCVRVIHEIPLPKPFTTTPLLAWLIFHLHCFTSHIVPFPLVLPPISYKTRPLLSPMLVLFMCPRCQMVDMWCIVRHNTLIKLKNLP
jgi:hypothetical protein